MAIRLGSSECFLLPWICPAGAVHKKLIIFFWRKCCATVIFWFMYFFVYLLSGKTVNQSQTHKKHILNNCWGVEECLYLMMLFQTVIWELTVTTGHSLVIPSRLVFGNFKIIFKYFVSLFLFVSILFTVL